MIKIENLSKKFGSFYAVKDLSFEVPRGHIFGFVGPNGAGKTTTMRILAGLLPPSGGKAWVVGHDVTENPVAVRAKIGFMPDFFGLYDDLKVLEYLEFYAGSYGIPPGKARKVSLDLLDLVELEGHQNAYVDSLSRGMKQRLGLARCLIHDPELLILDEPASGLDPRARVEIRELLKELKKMGKTILISSHILPELAELCSDIGIIEKGRLVACGTVEDIMLKAKMGRTLVVKVLEHAEKAAEIIKGYPQIDAVRVDGRVIKANFKGEKEELKEILFQLVNKSVPVISFSEEAGNLEDIFMKITEGGIE